jgi:hypothetical protein
MNGELSGLNQEKLRKYLQKAKRDPTKQKMIDQIQKSLANYSREDSGTPKERMAERLKQCRLQRGGRAMQQMQSALSTTPPPSSATTQTVTPTATTGSGPNESVQKTLSSTIGQQRRKRKEQLRKMGKKYGVITFERYTEALNKMYPIGKIGFDEIETPSSQLSHERNVVDLYLLQQNKVKEASLEIEVNEVDEADEICDIDQ